MTLLTFLEKAIKCKQMNRKNSKHNVILQQPIKKRKKTQLLKSFLNGCIFYAFFGRTIIMKENLIDEVKELNSEKDYATMSKENLVQRCETQDSLLKNLIAHLKFDNCAMLNKQDIMDIYHCESAKALKILRVMFNMGYGNKIGKEYYASRQSHEEFVTAMAGKEVFI